MNEIINVEGLMFGAPARLKYVTRFGTVHRVKDENVAEHCFFTAFFSLIICDWINANARYVKVNVGATLSRALMHDLEEAVSGDFPRPFKHSDPQLHAALEKAGVIAFNGAVDTFLNTPIDPYKPCFANTHIDKNVAIHTQHLTNRRAVELRERWSNFWMNAKDETLPGRIICVADFMSCAQYVISETQSGNIHIKNFLGGSMEKYFKFLKGDTFKELHPITEQIFELLKQEGLWD